MGFEPTYIKKLRLNRNLANEFTSIRQFLATVPGIEKMSNDELRALVINRAIEHSFSHEKGLLNILTQLTSNSRVNGANIELNIKTDNWEKLVVLVDRTKRWKRLDEWDLIEYCLKIYVEEIKNRRSMP